MITENALSGGIGAVGPAELLFQFRGAGVITITASSVDDGVKGVSELVRRGCVIIFVADDLLHGMGEILSHYSAEPWPVITGFPGADGSSANSKAVIRELVRKGIGIDIAGLTEI